MCGGISGFLLFAILFSCSIYFDKEFVRKVSGKFKSNPPPFISKDI